jgi:hypothetical protein
MPDKSKPPSDCYIGAKPLTPPLWGLNICDWLIEEFGGGNFEAVRIAFQSIEDLLREGGREVRESGLGFLQSLQEIASPKLCGIEALVEFFGPETRRLWVESNAIWRTSIKLDALDRSVLEAEVLAYRISQHVLH